jgi:hypothetical protein
MMPPTAQLLYIHFGMNADDDGFCEIFPIMRMTDSKPDDLRILQARRFIQVFDDKVLIILNWKENNYIQKDRYSESKYLKLYKEEIKNLTQKHECIQNVYKMDTQVRLVKDSIDNIIPARFIKPTMDELRNYCKERKNSVNTDNFFDFYESKGWMIGKNKMKDWKAAVRTWERNSNKSDQPIKEPAVTRGHEVWKEPDWMK